MNKDFDSWNEKKKEIHNRKALLFAEREIWWCDLGLNIGDEQDGKNHDYRRPVIVYRKYNRNIFLAIPLSTVIKENKYRYNFSLRDIEQSALLSQSRTLDARRLCRRIGKVPHKKFEELKKTFISLL